MPKRLNIPPDRAREGAAKGHETQRRAYVARLRRETRDLMDVVLDRAQSTTREELELDLLLLVEQVWKRADLVGYRRGVVSRRGGKRLPDNRFDCDVCGPAVAVDEDGCCRTCGMDAVRVVGNRPQTREEPTHA